MDILIETYHRLLRELVPSYHRLFYDQFRMESRVVGVIGSRGVGKTTFLINYLREHYGQSSQALYVSADNLYFIEHTLFSLVDQFVKEFDGKIICIDEIHKYKNWDIELKNIYDSFPKLSIIFSGSSSIDMIKAKGDLSRRAVLKTMYGFSFREYLEINEKRPYPVLTFTDIIKNHGKYEQELMTTPKLLGHLKTYWKEGYYPTRLEFQTSEAFNQSLRNIVDKIIYEDISSFYSLNTGSLDTLKKVLYYFATSQPGSVNINNIAISLKKDHSTIADYIQMLQETGVLRFLLTNKRGHALVRDAEKIYLDNTNLLYAINGEIGQEPLQGVIRELFTISNLQNSNNNVFFVPNGDIQCQEVNLEIGGKHKTGKQIQTAKTGFVVKDDILLGDAKTIPIYLFGFLY